MRDMAPREVSRTYDTTMRAWKSQYRRAARLVARGPHEATSVLDVGCGPGQLLLQLARALPDATVTGVDLGDEMLLIAKARVQASGLGDRIEVCRGDAYSLPFPDASFDVIVITQFLHMLDQPHMFFAEALRVLHPQGCLYIFDQRRDMNAVAYVAMWTTTALIRLMRLPLDGMGPVTDACYRPDELQSVLTESGFQNVAVEAGPIRLEARACRPG
jgi:ubiquinone/menaquinone biosynthesis C-methylase UbiE